ncbi:MAG: PQQ-binding-like beta-propeller repeat protein [Verrucomicrobiota bacterium]|jgi:outer membrane protein assembly factor BamB
MTKRFQSLKAIRLATYLLPPLGIVLLWRSSLVGWGRKILGTIFTLIYTLLYLTIIPGFLYFVAGIDVVEWRGGYMPVLTLSKTLPDYKTLEENRAKQAKLAATNSSPKMAQGETNYWTSFRGPNRDGHYDEKPILTRWPKEGLRQLWRQPIGGGYSSFIVADGRAYIIEQRRDREVVVAYAVSDGRELWTNGWPDRFEEPMGGEGPRATPTYDEGRVYAMGGNGEFRCLEADSGRTIWRRNILAENHGEELAYGEAVSPLIVEDKVIVLPGGTNGSSVAAYNKVTGAPIWKSQSDRQAYSSPMLVTLAGQRQVLIMSAQGVMGVLPENGRLLWHLTWLVDNFNSIAQPVVLSPNRFLLSAGYGKGCAAFEVTQSNAVFEAHEIWKNMFLKNKFTSSVLYEGCIYGLDDETLVCLDAESGGRKWRDGRFGYGQVLLASEHLVILGGNGDLALVKASPVAFEELARFPALHGKTWNHPAIADGKIFVRNAVEMACFDLGGDDAPKSVRAFH